jgi:hypothetical protein
MYIFIRYKLDNIKKVEINCCTNIVHHDSNFYIKF